MRWWNHQKKKKAVRKTRKLIFPDGEILKLRIFGERISGLCDDLVRTTRLGVGVDKFTYPLMGPNQIHIFM